MNTKRSSDGPLLSHSQRVPHEGVRAIVTGQVGLDKGAFLEKVAAIARENGHDVSLFHVGQRMCAEAPDIVPHRILDLPRPRLAALRRSVFKDILAAAQQRRNVIVNTHATFRWKHGLFHGYDFDQIAEFDADLYVSLVDNVDAVHERLDRDHEIRHTLKDILVWREEETVLTEVMAEAVAGYGHAYVVSRGDDRLTAKSFYRLMFEPERRRVYPSFPMTHVMDQPAVLADIEAFRDALAEHFITFDPGDVDEKHMLYAAGEATKRGKPDVTFTVNGREMTIGVTEITQVAHDIDAQIYARDFKMIDQSDMIISYIPTMVDGRPAISSGVERELQHAFEGTKEVYVIWKAACEPSPFVTETATKVFSTLDELFAHLQSKGYVGDYQLPLR